MYSSYLVVMFVVSTLTTKYRARGRFITGHFVSCLLTPGAGGRIGCWTRSLPCGREPVQGYEETHGDQLQLHVAVMLAEDWARVAARSLCRDITALDQGTD